MIRKTAGISASSAGLSRAFGFSRFRGLGFPEMVSREAVTHGRPNGAVGSPRRMPNQDVLDHPAGDRVSNPAPSKP